MANAPFAQFPGDFESLARQYWNTWNELLGRGGGMPDAWSLGGGLPSGLGGLGMGSMGTGTYDWYQRMQRLAADFSGGGSASDIAGAWRQMLGGQGADPFAGMLHSMHGGLAGGDWLEQMRPLLDMLLKPLRQQSAEWLQRPAFGPAREHQERLQALALAWQQWETSNEAFTAQLAQAGQSAFSRFEELLGQHDAPGKRLESARALFDLWIDAAEDAWAEVALSTEYRHAYAEMTNALMHLRLRLQNEVEQFGALLGLPGRSELDALHRKVADLDRALHAARKASAAPRATQAASGRASAEAAAQATPTAVKPAARRAARPVAKAVAPKKKATARRSPTRAEAARVEADVVAPVSAQQAKAAKAATPVKAATKPAKAEKMAKAKPKAKKPGKATATRTPVPARPAATTPRKPAVAARKPSSAAKGAARPATSAAAPRKTEATRPVAAAVRKPVATVSRRAPVKAAAKQAPQASTSTARKARVAKGAGARTAGSASVPKANGGSPRKAVAASAPATAKVVSMKDWVSRNLAAPADKERGGGKRKGRSR